MSIKDMLDGFLHSKLMTIAAIIILFVFSLKLINFLLRKLYKKHNEIYWRYLGNIIRAVTCIFFVSLLGTQFSITSQLSIELFKGTGLAVAVIGFAAQEVLKDILAGFVISIAKPYNIGDRISIVSLSLTGLVEDITLRHTVIKCFDNSRVIVPNSVINRDILKSTDYTDSIAGNFLEIGISYESDIRLASAILKSVILANPLVVDISKGNSDRSCDVLVKDFSDSAIILKTTVWTRNVDDNFKACSEIRTEIIDAFRRAGIVIPFNCVTVYDASAPASETQQNENKIEQESS